MLKEDHIRNRINIHEVWQVATQKRQVELQSRKEL